MSVTHNRNRNRNRSSSRSRRSSATIQGLARSFTRRLSLRPWRHSAPPPPPRPRQPHSRPLAPEDRHGVVLEDAESIRRRASHFWDRRQKLPAADIYRLAILEDVVLNPPGAPPVLSHGLMARLRKYGPSWYFLGYDSYYYKSSNEYGFGDDLSFVVDTYVPLGIRLFAAPYKHLCRNRR
ncbi:uncharacterized protein F4822DRAFT_35470 [Hypoxylon trugodes]|uniref:uncharacterized protein n=1 Tax=Hypoxylon trugodes TaxID=326681 RepID=UPI0021966BBE|nr:uncharacterized protein F4822DRAFT_35470 [Hypoxylon trugodes]KAI1394069.1 hypothetical protein F4822DRAFT_35470 [Hypoxylon trugodes]